MQHTGIGIASVTHHVIINTAMDKTIQAFFPTEKDLQNKKTRQSQCLQIKKGICIVALKVFARDQFIWENTIYFGFPLTKGFPFI